MIVTSQDSVCAQDSHYVVIMLSHIIHFCVFSSWCAI